MCHLSLMPELLSIFLVDFIFQEHRGVYDVQIQRGGRYRSKVLRAP